MKKREMVSAIEQLLVAETKATPGTLAIERLLDETPYQWPPEEWRLPEKIVAGRVVDCDGLHLLPKAPGKPLTDDQIRRIYEAAEEAYNVDRPAARRWHRVVEKALAEVRKPATTFERVLAILEERA
jgi:hypothetical protein